MGARSRTLSCTRARAGARKGDTVSLRANVPIEWRGSRASSPFASSTSKRRHGCPLRSVVRACGPDGGGDVDAGGGLRGCTQ
eukprot:6173069-Pleurochrysis_carterae.AAC.1